MKIPDEEFYKHPSPNPRYLAKNYPELTEYLKITYPELTSISEQLYWFRHGLKTKPTCPICGGPVAFDSITKGYRGFCSVKCSRNSDATKNKAKQTCIERYGVDNPTKNKMVKAKTKQTCIERYGVDNPSKAPEIIDRINSTFLNKYGVKWGGQIEDVKNRIKQTCIERYGVGSGVETATAKNARIESSKQRLLARYTEITNVDDGKYVCACPHTDCHKCIERTYVVEPSTFFDRRRDGTEPCTTLLPEHTHGTSTLELTIQRIFDNLGIKYDIGRWDLIKNPENGHPWQLDMVFDNGIAIEVNGDYPHSSNREKTRVFPKKHMIKHNVCAANGIRLITIWECWIKNKYPIVESILKSKFGIYDRRLFARKCRLVKNIKPKVAKQFLDENHIQGSIRSTYKYGLVFNGELVALMLFGRPTKTSGKGEPANTWILSRFAAKLGTQVVGAAGRLLHHFINDVKPDMVVSYSANDISDGGVYKKLGFKQDGKPEPTYWWIEPRTHIRHYRGEFTLGNLYKLGLKRDGDGKTERQIMTELGYMECYDSGIVRWVLQCNE